MRVYGRFSDDDPEVVSLATTHTSEVMDLQQQRGFAFQIVQTADPAVTVTVFLQGAIINEDVAFTTVQDGTFTVTGTDKLLVEYDEPHFRYARIILSASGGTANITLYKQRKGT